MKIFKKAIALITVAIMALSVNAFAIVFEDDVETINTVAAWASAQNDNYMCVKSGAENYNGYTNSLVHVYKNVGNDLKSWATVYPCFSTDSGDVPYVIGRLAIGAGNKLYMCLESRGSQGAPAVGIVDLDDLKEGDKDVKTFKSLRWDTAWGTGNFVKVYPYGDYVLARKSNGNVCAYDANSEFMYAYAYGSLGPWDPTLDLNYAIKNKGSSTSVLELYDGNEFSADSSNKLQFTDLKYKLKLPGSAIKDVVVSGNYAVAMQDGEAYIYDLTNASPDTEIEYRKPEGSIGGTYGGVDIYGKYCAIYTKSTHWLTIIDLETGKTVKQWGNVPSGGASDSAFVKFNALGVSVMHSDGKTDVYKAVSGVKIDIDSGKWKYADLIDGELVEDLNAAEYVKMEVSITNATLEDIEDGNVILAAYEGDLLTGVSVKPLAVEAEKTGTVTTEFVPYSTTLKVFYWTSDYEPIVAEPYVDIWVD